MSDPRDAPRDLGNLAEGEFARVYDQLRAVARRMLLDQKPGHTLQATALVHEAWLRLLRSGSPGVDGEGHFHRLAAVAMRHILIDHARRRGRQKRADPARRLSLDAVELASEDRTDDILDVDAAIERLRAAEPLLLAAAEHLPAHLPMPYGRARAQSTTRLVDLYTRWGKPDEAERWRQRAR
ncbi:MAG: RNA polymerase subunit sigma [Planctomycetes bacterium]|nr:RNA polymerase subunit sigma [Planctomycetota bacterium]